MFETCPSHVRLRDMSAFPGVPTSNFAIPHTRQDSVRTDDTEMHMLEAPRVSRLRKLRHRNHRPLPLCQAERVGPVHLLAASAHERTAACNFTSTHDGYVSESVPGNGVVRVYRPASAPHTSLQQHQSRPGTVLRRYLLRVLRRRKCRDSDRPPRVLLSAHDF